MKKIKSILTPLVLTILLVSPYFVFANAPLENLKTLNTDGAAGYVTEVDDTTISEIIGTGINAFLSILGIVFIILMLFAGYSWMMAQGEEEKVKKAQDTIKRAIIGLIITVGSYAIWDFVSRIL